MPEIETFDIAGAFSQRTYSGRKHYPSVVDFTGAMYSNGEVFVGSMSDKYGRSQIQGRNVDPNLMTFKKQYHGAGRTPFYYFLADCGPYYLGQFSDGGFEDDAHGVVMLRLTPASHDIPQDIGSRLDKVPAEFSVKCRTEEFIAIPDRLAGYERWQELLQRAEAAEDPETLDVLAKELVADLHAFF